MFSSFGYYIFALIVLVVGIFVIKKVTTCLIKSIIIGIVVAILAAVYFLYF